MERFPRGTLPPSAFEAVATLAPTAVARRPPRPVEAAGAVCPAAVAAAEAPADAEEHDLSTTCPSCGTEMRPEHAHYRCPACGYRDSCCF